LVVVLINLINGRVLAEHQLHFDFFISKETVKITLVNISQIELGKKNREIIHIGNVSIVNDLISVHDTHDNLVVYRPFYLC
jgi:hypothetical protein